MMPDAGMVMIQARMMPLATFQRTAETFLAAPTPMIAPVIVWVVETGMPSSVAMNRGEAGDLRPHGLDDPPAARERAERHRGLARQHDPERNAERPAQVALRIEQDRDDPHGLLRVVAAVAERVERGGHELHHAELAIDRVGRRAHEQPRDDERQQQREREADERR